MGTVRPVAREVGGIVAVHAHPDDESITMGATLARYRAAGVPVMVVTATLGENGELMHGDLAGLAADHADQLGGYRLGELHLALAAMGVKDHRFLGGLGRFRDSGMAGEPAAQHPRAFIHAQIGGPAHEAAVGALVDILTIRRPAVIISYDATGGYGHPDHIAAYQVTKAAVTRWAAGVSGRGRSASDAALGDASGAHDDVPAFRLLEVVRPRGEMAAALQALWEAPMPAGYLRPQLGDLGTLVADGEIDIAVPVGPWQAQRRRAMAAHGSQLGVWAGAVDGFALTNLRAQPLLPTEYFRVLAGLQAPLGARDVMSGL